MEPGLTLILSSETLTGLVSILKNGKMSTLMKIEPFVLETSISDIFFNGVLTKVHREKMKQVPVGRSS